MPVRARLVAKGIQGGSRRGAIRIWLDNRSVRRSVRNIDKIKRRGYQRRAVRPAVNKTATVLNKAVKKSAKSVGTYTFTTEEGQRVITAKGLSKSVGVRRRTYSKSGHVVAVVGPRFSFRASDGTKSHPSKYAAFIEGEFRHDGMEPGPRRWFRPAARSNIAKMKSTFVRELAAGTKKVARQLKI